MKTQIEIDGPESQQLAYLLFVHHETSVLALDELNLTPELTPAHLAFYNRCRQDGPAAIMLHGIRIKAFTC